MEKKIYKYQEEYDRLSPKCPPTNHKATEINPVYRWIFNELDDPRNFTSQYARKPRRFLGKGDELRCKAMGLSMFNDLNGCIARFRELLEQIGENAYLALGNRIASGKLEGKEGVNGPIERLGHFTHHSFQDTDYTQIFALTESKL